MKVALVYDRVNKVGGAERVLQVLHEMYPSAPLYTAVYNRETASWAETFDVRATFLQSIPLARTNHEYFAWLAPIAFETLDFSEFDLVISITSEYAKGIITKPNAVHICYCLTPTRYLWSGYDEYFKDPLTKWLSKLVVSYLRMWDKVAAHRPDAYIAISKTVQGRIKKYYERESEVVYPPVSLQSTVYSLKRKKKAVDGRRLTEDFFLIVSRLVPYKRIDIAIEAFNKLGWQLKIVGAGREIEKLKAMAGSTIEFVQNLTDGQLIRYYQDCTALIFPGEEDFGLSILEAQAFGKPVIAYKAGGALETVVEGKTGLFFYPQTVTALIDTLRKFDKTTFDHKQCIENARNFSKSRFKKEFMKFVEERMNA